MADVRLCIYIEDRRCYVVRSESVGIDVADCATWARRDCIVASRMVCEMSNQGRLSFSASDIGGGERRSSKPAF